MRRWALVATLGLVVSCASTSAAKARAAAVENPPRAELPYCPPAPQHVLHVQRARAWAGASAAIEGTVHDRATGAVVPDVTVVATSTTLRGSASALTDDEGAYRLPDLPAGDYEVVFYYGEIKARQPHVETQNGEVTLVTIQMDTAAFDHVEYNDVRQKAPLIEGDFGAGPGDPNAHGGRLWSGRGVAIGQDYTKNLPLVTRPDEPAAPPACRPPPAAKPTPAPAAPRGRR
jgi:hypothetical protein